MVERNRQRERVLEIVAASSTPIDADTVADAAGIHVTTARFHLNNLIADGEISADQLPATGRGRPRLVYSAPRPLPIGQLLGLLLDQLGGTEAVREELAARAGRCWAQPYLDAVESADVPDPVTVAGQILQRLGFRITESSSVFGTHELKICSCPLRGLADTHPEVVRGVQRGILEEAFARCAPAFAAQYRVLAQPNSDGDCAVTIRLAPLTTKAEHPL